MTSQQQYALYEWWFNDSNDITIQLIATSKRNSAIVLEHLVQDPEKWNLCRISEVRNCWMSYEHVKEHESS